jgi:hypothetical protein
MKNGLITEKVEKGEPLNVPRIMERIIGLNEYINKWKKIREEKYARNNHQVKVSEVQDRMVAEGK